MATAVEKFFSLPELLEQILLGIADPFCLTHTAYFRAHSKVLQQFFVLQRTSRLFRDVIRESQAIRYYMCLPGRAYDPQSNVRGTERERNGIRLEGSGISLTQLTGRYFSDTIELSTGTAVEIGYIHMIRGGFRVEVDVCSAKQAPDHRLREGADVPPSWLEMEAADIGSCETKIDLAGYPAPKSYGCGKRPDKLNRKRMVTLWLPRQNSMKYLCRGIRILIGEEEDPEAGTVVTRVERY